MRTREQQYRHDLAEGINALVAHKKQQSLPTPLQDRVLVRRIEEPEGLIIKPDIAKQKPLKAEVLKVGPGKRREDSDGGWYFIPTQVKAGQTVLLSPTVNMGNWSDIIEGSGVTMIQEADILGVIE